MKSKNHTFTTQMSLTDFKQMEKIREALGMKRNEFIKYMMTMFINAYPDVVLEKKVK